jgi:hypothetical protein
MPMNAAGVVPSGGGKNKSSSAIVCPVPCIDAKTGNP